MISAGPVANLWDEPALQPRSVPVAIPESCGFCGRGRAEVRVLVLGPKNAICGDCVADCNAALAEMPETPRAGHRPTPNHARAREFALGQGYTGDQCDHCGHMTMRQSGTCLVCDTCGVTSGCS